MIYPDKNRFHCKILDIFLDYKFKSEFSSVQFHHDHIQSVHSLLLIGNHITWWDGFIAWQLNRALLKKDFYLMMHESQLKKMEFFRKVGCFSINPGNRDVVQSLQYGADLLKDPGKMVVFYPQGKLRSLYDEEFIFNSGIERILENNTNTMIVFYAAFIDYSSNEKPYLNVFLSELPTMCYSHQQLQVDYKSFYQQSQQKHIALFKP